MILDLRHQINAFLSKLKTNFGLDFGIRDSVRLVNPKSETMVLPMMAHFQIQIVAQDQAENAVKRGRVQQAGSKSRIGWALQ
jgi:hypothetical protein